MRIDQILEHNYNGKVANSSASQNYNQSPITHVLVTLEGGSFFRTRFSIKVRTNKTIHLLADNMDGLILQSISNLRYGLTTSVTREMSTINTLVGTTDQGVYDRSLARAKKPNSILVPVGHLTLSGKYELEVSVSTQSSNDNTENCKMKVFGVHTQFSPDHLIIHDTTGDNDATADGVREVFVIPTGDKVSFVSVEPGKHGEYEDLRIELKTKTFQTSANIEDYLALTGIFGEFEYPSISNIAKIVSYDETLPENDVRIKLLGSFRDNALTIIMKELLLEETSSSTLEQLRNERQKVQELEQKNSELARRYRHAGKIVRSEDIQQAEKIIEIGKMRED